MTWDTILSWGGRPRDRLGSSICRYGVWYNEPYNCRYFQTNSEWKDEADNCWNNVSKNDWNNGLSSAGFRLRHRLLFRLRWSERRSCRRKRVHSGRYFGRYFPSYILRYFATHIEGTAKAATDWCGSNSNRARVPSPAAPVAP